MINLYVLIPLGITLVMSLICAYLLVQSMLYRIEDAQEANEDHNIDFVGSWFFILAHLGGAAATGYFVWTFYLAPYFN